MMGRTSLTDCDVSLTRNLKRPLGKTVFVGPDMPAYLVGPVTLPITEMTLFCDRCLQKGHLSYGCPNDVKCCRCKENGHTADKCVYLQEHRVSQRKQQRADTPTDKPTTNPVHDAVDTFMTSVIHAEKTRQKPAPTDQTNDSTMKEQPETTRQHVGY